MGYSSKHYSYFNNETGEWLEKIGFCSAADTCDYCQVYEQDGRPATAFDAPEDAIDRHHYDEEWD